MPKYRRNRINDAVAKEAADIVRNIKDPRVSGVIVTITGADVTGDLKYAKIFYSCLGETDDRELSLGLKSAAPFVRRELASRLNLRITPELTFVKDDGVKHGAEISAILHKLESDKKGE
ncbi:MAG: 30S ribosome-binding factor RbfA [Clostridiales bacterium]|nr:30S ribosome-binding factor RbfA [Clostridiales bacterium]